MLDARYRVIDRIGQGGMGEVYRAEDLKLGEPVAPKFLPSRLGQDPAALARLHQEVRTARRGEPPECSGGSRYRRSGRGDLSVDGAGQRVAGSGHLGSRFLVAAWSSIGVVIVLLLLL